MTAVNLDGARIGSGRAPGVARLIAELRPAPARPLRVVEVGTRRAVADFPTHHAEWAPAARWLKVDIAVGPDVDLVDDAHTLRQVGRVARGVGAQELAAADMLVGPGEFDAYVACSVFEHLERPWLAMKAAASVVRPGGLVYVQTHQTFPIHGYPSDFWRFTTDALEVLAGDAGLDVVESGYLYPCRIQPGPEVTRWNDSADVLAFLNVELLARRPA